MRTRGVGLAVLVILLMGLGACKGVTTALEVPLPQGQVELNTMPIEQGWCGVAWGATMGQFKKRYPRYHVYGASTSYNYGSGMGAQRWLGYEWMATYNFNENKLLRSVDLLCRNCNAMEAASVLTRKYGYPTGGTTTWKKGDVKIQIMGTQWGRVRVSHKKFK
ncbi:MAG: hypothetical protein KJ621_20765 [Proteobacteria bacterium]|nr:hypothetical protein [Pseudomonadota bacterium]